MDSDLAMFGGIVFVIAVAVAIGGVQCRIYNVEADRERTVQNEAAQKTAQACIASQRSASDCALILHGTGR